MNKRKWLNKNCTDLSAFPYSGRAIYQGNGYEVKNCKEGKVYKHLYKAIKNGNITMSDILSKFSYYMSYGGEFKRRCHGM